MFSRIECAWIFILCLYVFVPYSVLKSGLNKNFSEMEKFIMILLLGIVTVFHFLRTENCDAGNMYGILLDKFMFDPN